MVRDEIADATIDLLLQIGVMRIQRVVEVEHPDVDMGEAAGFLFLHFHHASTAVISATAGIQSALTDTFNISASEYWVIRLRG